MTTITDTVTYVDGSPATGQIILSWPPFVTSGGVSIAGGQIEYPLGVDGAVTIICYPNIGAQPLGTYYTATYELDRGPVYDEFWIIPPTPATTSIGAVRAQFPATPSIMINAQQLTGSGAQSGQFLGWNGSSWVPMFVSGANFAVQSWNQRQGNVMPQAGDYTVAQVTGAVPNTRQVLAGSGLTGGGPLSADVTLAVVGASTVQQVIILDDGTLVGAASQLNFIPGTGILLDISAAPPNGVNIRVTNSGGGGGGGAMAIYQVNGVFVGQRPQLNLVAGTGITLSGLDNGVDTVSVTVNAAPGLWTENADGSIYYNGGDVGVGTNAPAAPLHVASGQTDGGNFWSLYIDPNSTAGNAAPGMSLGKYNGIACIAAFAVANLLIEPIGGNVGIGITTNPIRVLQVGGTAGASTTNSVMIQGYQVAFEVMNAALNQNWFFGVDDADSNKLKIGVGRSAQQGLVPTMTMVVGQPGLVGIGTTSPGAPLSFGGIDNRELIRYYDAGTAANCAGVGKYTDEVRNYVPTPSNFYTWYAGGPAGTELMRLTANPFLGIGTPSPQALLHVLGTQTTAYAAYFCMDDGNPANQKTILIGMGVGPAPHLFAALAAQQSGPNNYGDGDLLIYTGAGGVLGERMRVTNAGYVGIGTTGPFGIFQVRETNGVNIFVSDAILVSGSLSLNVVNDNNSSNQPLEIRASMTCFTAGSVAISTAPPRGPFDVIGGRSYFSANSEIYAIRLEYSVNSTGCYLGSDSGGTFVVSNNTGATCLLVDQSGNCVVEGALKVGPYSAFNQAGDLGVSRGNTNAGAIYFGNAGSAYIYWDGTNFNIDQPAIASSLTSNSNISAAGRIYAANWFQCNGAGTGIVFGDGTQQTTAAVSSTGYWVADANGINYGGHVSVAGGSSSVYTLQSMGNFFVNGVPYSTSSTGFTPVSDVRMKRNVRPFTDGLELVRLFRPVRFEYNGEGGTPEGLEAIGIIAQEVLPLAPYLIQERPDGMLGYNPTPMPWVLLNAIREMDRTIEELRRKLDEIKS